MFQSTSDFLQSNDERNVLEEASGFVPSSAGKVKVGQCEAY